jgi:hypothetical protein
MVSRIYASYLRQQASAGRLRFLLTPTEDRAVSLMPEAARATLGYSVLIRNELERTFPYWNKTHLDYVCINLSKKFSFFIMPK